jgi:nicotinate phosphoribosyltransferase
VGALLTDFYQLTMLAAYHELGLRETAVFELYLRRLPAARNFALAAGLDLLVDYLQTLRFSEGDLDWLAGTGRFATGFLDALRGLSFTGDLDAVPEGTLVFAEEPILRIRAPLAEAQLVESRLINLVHLSTLIASKAARCVIAAQGRGLVDFGMRRAHGAEAAVHAARAAYVAGFFGTATVEAARAFDIPVFGTMAHSYIEAHDDERAAFSGFARCHPGNVTLLLDTYDTLRAAGRVVDLVRAGTAVQGVRLDSGDLHALSLEVRRILDAGGCREVRIVASSSLDEYEITRLLAAGAAIDVFGVGTRLDVSEDVPALDLVYKLQEYGGHPRRKRSPDKATWPGAKQVFRQRDDTGHIVGDVVALEGEQPGGEALLVPVLRGGRRVRARESLEDIRSRSAASLAGLGGELRTLRAGARYPVARSTALEALALSAGRDG